MSRRSWPLLALMLVALVLAACGSDDVEDTQPNPLDPVDNQACVEEWNALSDRWAALPNEFDDTGSLAAVDDGERYHTYEDWAAAKGLPTSYEELCE